MDLRCLLLPLLASCAPAMPTIGDSSAVDTVDVIVSADAESVDAVSADTSSADAASVDVSVDAADSASADASDGALPACVFGEACPSGTQCFTTGCLPVLPLGASCVPYPGPGYVQCASGSSCVEREGGRVCAAYGEIGVRCRYEWPHCDPGLGCSDNYRWDGVCVRGLPRGSLCTDLSQICADNASCRFDRGAYRCVSDGALGGLCLDPVGPTPELGGSTRCDPGLQCNHAGRVEPAWAAVCLRVVNEGAECEEAGARCADGLSCVATDERHRVRRCVANGGRGAACLTATDPAARCAAGLECSGASRCIERVARGGACDPSGETTVCAAGDACSVTDSADRGRCVPPGAAGGDCRSTETDGCDGALECSMFSRYRATCRVVASVGDRCDVGAASVLCPRGSRCLAGVASHELGTGQCARPIAEIEPNNMPTFATSATSASVMYEGSLSAADPRDCFAVSVAEGASLRLEVTGAASIVHLFVASGEVGRWALRPGSIGPLEGAALVTPEQSSALRSLAAGVRSVCITTAMSGTAPQPYVLTVAVLRAP